MSKLNYQAVEIDETWCFQDWLDKTEEHDGGAKYKPYIEKITEVYCFNQNEVTRICSFQTNYWLVWCYRNVYWKENTPDEIRELFYDEDLYESWGEDDYVGCSTIDKLPLVDMNFGNNENITLEDVREYLSGNHVI